MANTLSPYIPIISDNRRETILIQYSNVIANINEAILKYMLSHKEYYERYPLLNIISKEIATSNFDLYTYGLICKERHLLFLLSTKLITDKRILNEDMEQISLNYDLNKVSVSILAEAIYRLSKEKFVDNIYIVDEKFNDKKLNHIYKIYLEESDNKIKAIENTMKGALLEVPNATTIMMEDADDLYDIITTFNADQLFKKMFMISMAPINLIDKSKDDTSHENYNHFDYFFKDQIKNGSLPCMVRAFYPFKV